MGREGLVHGILHLSVSVFVVSSNFCFILHWLNLLVSITIYILAGCLKFQHCQDFTIEDTVARSYIFIAAVHNDEKVDVSYVDFGNSEKLSFAELRKLPDMFLRLPKQVYLVFFVCENLQTGLSCFLCLWDSPNRYILFSLFVRIFKQVYLVFFVCENLQTGISCFLCL